VEPTLSLDTSHEVEARQIEGWRRMTPAAKLALVLQLSAVAREMALAGVRLRYPAASPKEQRLRLAQVVLGDDLARKAYPEIAGLAQP
jgi:hypothetical protein